MYNKIMVPLDGSALAECVIPNVESAVKGCQSPEVIFVRVVEPVALYHHNRSWDLGDSAYTADEQIKKVDAMNIAGAKEYLTKLVGTLKYGGASLRTEVLVGKAADTLADYAGKNGIDLIIIASHGRSGVSRWVLGSTADRIMRSACVPVLIVRVPGCIPGF